MIFLITDYKTNVREFQTLRSFHNIKIYKFFLGGYISRKVVAEFIYLKHGLFKFEISQIFFLNEFLNEVLDLRKLF
ncbi:MAG: hypothetical protein ACOC2U_02920 [bacterium]